MKFDKYYFLKHGRRETNFERTNAIFSMKRILLIVFTVPLLSLHALGQQSAATQTPSVLPTISHADTTRAIHALFSKHRTGGWIWTAIGSAFAIRIVSVASNAGATQGFTGSPTGKVVGFGLFGGLPTAIGIGKLVRFSKTKEDETVALHEKSNILPPYVKRRLNIHYFKR